MKSRFWYLIIIACLLITAVPLAAQEDNLALLDQEGSATVFVPDGWEIMPAAEFDEFFAEIEGLDASILTNGALTALILTPGQIEALLEGDEDADSDNPFTLFFAVYRRVYDELLPLEGIESTTIGDYQTYITRYDYELSESETFEGEAYWIVLDEETNEAFFVDIYGAEGDIEPARDDIDAIVESLVGSDEPADEPAEASGEACTVETAAERSATVRVGPGEHRTALTFLKANQSYTVEGRFAAEDGAVWYRLVKDEVDPGSSAAELWTAAEGLTETGACDTVGEASAPPLRPIIEARPTAVPGDTNSGGGEDPGTTVTGGVTPASGTWVFNYDSIVRASCAGGGQGEIPFSEFGFDSSETLDVVAEPDGSALTIAGYYYPRINETLFLGDDTLGDYNVQIYLFPESTTRLHLEVRFNLVIDGFSCSMTVSGNGSRQ